MRGQVSEYTKLTENKNSNSGDDGSSLSASAYTADFANIIKQAEKPGQGASANLPRLSLASFSADGKASTAPVIEVPPLDELDTPEWHEKQHERKTGLPGEYLPAVTPRVPPDARVEAALTQINGNTMKQRLEEISGKREVLINGQKTTIDSRSTYGDGYKLALEYFKEKFEKEGYTVILDKYTRWGDPYYNLRAIKVGQTKPDEIVMFGAHIDSTAGNPWQYEPKAPGADDDGSGAVGVAEIAHAIKDLPLDRTVVFSLFSGEEEGLWGSRAMAELYKQHQNTTGRGKEGLGKLIGMYQMDMIGYSQNSKTIESHDTTSNQAAHKLTANLAEQQQRYGIDLKVYGAHNEQLTNRSDHYPFMRIGVPAVLVIEPYDTAPDLNPNYHSTNDTVDKVDVPYMANVAKIVAAAGVELAGLRTAPGSKTQTDNTAQPPTKVPALAR